MNVSSELQVFPATHEALIVAFYEWDDDTYYTATTGGPLLSYKDSFSTLRNGK